MLLSFFIFSFIRLFIDLCFCLFTFYNSHFCVLTNSFIQLFIDLCIYLFYVLSMLFMFYVLSCFMIYVLFF